MPYHFGAENNISGIMGDKTGIILVKFRGLVYNFAK